MVQIKCTEAEKEQIIDFLESNAGINPLCGSKNKRYLCDDNCSACAQRNIDWVIVN